MAQTPAWLLAEVAEVFDSPTGEIGADENLLDHGLDSVRLMAMVRRWRDDGREVTFAQFAERPTLSAWAELLAGAADDGDRR